MNPDDYVTPEGRYAEHVQEMSGAPPQAGMAPYPLYGLPPLGQEDVNVPFYKKPVFCLVVGGAAGVGIGYLVWGWLLPRMKPMRKNKKKAAETEEA